jgi:hypothetical protein
LTFQRELFPYRRSGWRLETLASAVTGSVTSPGTQIGAAAAAAPDVPAATVDTEVNPATASSAVTATPARLTSPKASSSLPARHVSGGEPPLRQSGSSVAGYWLKAARTDCLNDFVVSRTAVGS